MSRLLVLITAVTACGALASGLPSALLADAPDADRALDRLTEAAADGDVYALHELAEARRRGYVRASSQSGRIPTHLPIWSWPGQAWLAHRNFERTLRDSVAAGHSDALFLTADRLLQPWRRGHSGGVGPTEADRDSANVLFDRLVGREPSSLRLAFLAKQLRREADYERLLTEAAGREPRACAFHLAMTFRKAGPSGSAPSPSEQAEFLDAAAVCADLFETHDLDERDPGSSFVVGLVEQTASGNAEAADLLAGLRAEGVFERHPRFAALLPDAPSAEAR